MEPTEIIVVPKSHHLQEPPEFSISAAKIDLLVTEYETLTIDGVDDREGYQIAHKARMNVRAHLLEIEACRKQTKQAAWNYGKLVDTKMLSLPLKEGNPDLRSPLGS